MTRSFNAFFHLRLIKRLIKQSCGWWFETPLQPLWRHCNKIFLPDASTVSIVSTHQLSHSYYMRYTWNLDRETQYNYVIMGAMASQITSLTIVYSTVYSGAGQRKHQISRHMHMCGETFSLKEMFLKMLPAKWWPICLGLSVLMYKIIIP